MKHADIYGNARFAGSIKRYHTWPFISTQTVGEHTWQIFRIYYSIWGELPPHVTTAIIWHDAGELFAGDTPYPAKKASPGLRGLLKTLEIDGVEQMGGPWNADGKLTTLEQIKIKICDNLDMLEHGLVEMAMGNRLMEPVANVTYAWLIETLDWDNDALPHLDKDYAIRYLLKVRKAALTYGIPSEVFIIEKNIPLAAQLTKLAAVTNQPPGTPVVLPVNI